MDSWERNKQLICLYRMILDIISSCISMCTTYFIIALTCCNWTCIKFGHLYDPHIIPKTFILPFHVQLLLPAGPASSFSTAPQDGRGHLRLAVALSDFSAFVAITAT